MSAFGQLDLDFVRDVIRSAESNGISVVCLSFRRPGSDYGVSVSWPSALDRSKVDISAQVKETHTTECPA